MVMDTDRFWALVEQARGVAGPAADQAVRDVDEADDDPDHGDWTFEDLDASVPRPSGGPAGSGPAGSSMAGDADNLDLTGHYLDDEDDDYEDDDDYDVTDPVAVALLNLLSELSAEEIASFDNIFEEQRLRAGGDDMINAAVLIEHGVLGEDSFDDFRAGLVSLGRTTFEAAVANPDSLAGHPVVQEIAAASDFRWLGREDLLYVASHAYAVVTGQDQVTFYEYAETLRDDDARHSDGPNGQGGVVALDDESRMRVEWSVGDEVETRRRLPRLAGMFYERSMRNRRRTMNRLGMSE